MSNAGRCLTTTLLSGGTGLGVTPGAPAPCSPPGLAEGAPQRTPPVLGDHSGSGLHGSRCPDGRPGASAEHAEAGDPAPSTQVPTVGAASPAGLVSLDCQHRAVICLGRRFLWPPPSLEPGPWVKAVAVSPCPPPGARECPSNRIRPQLAGPASLPYKYSFWDGYKSALKKKPHSFGAGN